jgi:putative hydroxymethylpyrimidine transport system substrate-binding protein
MTLVTVTASSRTMRIAAAAGAAIAALALVVAAGCGGSGTVAPAASASTGASPAASGVPSSAATARPEVTKVDLMMDWVPWVLDIPVDVAQAKGFYAAAGLQVSQTVPTGATDVVKFVSTGRAQFGLYYAPDILTAVSEGAPLVSVAGIMSHAPVGLALAPGVTASSPKDLAGKVVGVPLIPSTRASFDSLLQAAGMKAGDVRVADPGFDIVAPLLAGKYAAVAVTAFGELVQAEAQGQKLSYLDFRKWGTPDYAFLNVVTNSQFAKQNPNTVRAFVKATLAGLDYAAQHPEEAVALYVARHPELKKDLLLAQWKAALPSMATAGTHAAGWQDPKAWSALDDWLVRVKLLTQRVDLTSSVDDGYLPAP